MEYYVKVTMDDHLLYTTEIAERLFNIGWTSSAGKSPVSFLNAYLNKISEELCCEEMYYNTRHGLKRVWPKAVLKSLLSQLNNLSVTAEKQAIEFTIKYHSRKYNSQYKSLSSR